MPKTLNFAPLEPTNLMYMLVKSIHRAAPCGAAAIVAILMAACIDKDYNLDDVDMTVGVGQAIQLPSNNTTGDICLNDVLDLGNNNFLTINDDGLYSIAAIDDEELVAHMGVPRFTVSQRTYKGTYVIDLGDFDPRKTTKRKVRGADTDIEFEAPMVDLDFSMKYNSKNIQRLEWIGFNTNMIVTLTFAKDLLAALSNIHTMRFTLPQCLQLGKAAYKGDSISADDKNTYELHDVKTAEGLKFVVNVKGIDLNGKKADGSYMNYVQGDGFHFHGALSMSVVVKESAVDFDKVAEAKDLSVNGTAVLEKFYVNKARGGFSPVREFDRVGGVSLKNIPSFLTDDDVNLDLYNPELNINIYSSVPFATKMTGAIVAKDNQGNVVKRIDVPEFSYKANGESIVSLRRRPATHESDTTVVVIPDICDVFRNLPDSIALIDLDGVGDASETTEITLSNYYQGRMRLSVASGIALGSDALIIYKKDYTGWNDQFKDIRFVETDNNGQKTVEGFVRVTANIASKVPAFLTLKAHGIDINGNVISSDRLEVEVEKTIAASTDGKTAATTEEVINIRPKDPDVFKTLDGLAFRIEMAAKNGGKEVTGVMLNAYKQTIKVSNIKVQKYGKMAIDLN